MVKLIPRDFTLESLKDEYGKIDNVQMAIYAASGEGKSLACEGIVKKFHDAGYLILILDDPKDEFEYAYQMWKPLENDYRTKYLLDFMKKLGTRPTSKPVKIYHPFTFNIPRNKRLPDINLYTFDISTFQRDEWSIITETESDKETVGLLLDATTQLTKEEGIYSLLYKIYELTKSKESRKKRKIESKNFNIDLPLGQSKSVSELLRYFKPFQKHYFLAKENCEFNINWKEILKDQAHYHVFTSKWITDKKLKGFNVFALLQGFLRNQDYCKHPVLLVFPEIRKRVPFRPQGFEYFVAKSIKEALGVIRSQGKGTSSLMDSQIWKDVDQNVRDSSTVTYFGTLGGGSDLESVCKAYKFGTDIQKQLKQMDQRNSYLRKGEEDSGPITLFFSGARHAEPFMNFIDEYKRECPEKCRTYADILDKMEKIKKEDDSKTKQKARAEIEKEREEEEKKRKKREERKKEKEEKSDDSPKIKKFIEEDKLKMGKIIYEYKNDPNIPDKQKSLNKMGKKFVMDKHTVKSRLQLYENHLQKQQKKSDEELILEELNTSSLGEDNG